MDPAYVIKSGTYAIAGASASNFNMTATVANAHDNLVADAYHDPWGGWWKVALHASGKLHAEQLLHMMHPNAPAIGISNPYGPCPSCVRYFQLQGYRNLYWPEWGEIIP